MAIPKVMGIETEYGITVKNQPDFNPILSSLLLINSYETYRSSRVRWDYEAESCATRAGSSTWRRRRRRRRVRLINLILSNGARFYVDHAHPEYSSPETTNPRDLVIWDRAGERILSLSRQRAEAVSPPEQRILIYKNNTDNKGNSYGTHENYLMDRKVPFARIVQHMMPFFVTRQIFTGAGKVGAENNAGPCDYQISQRADFLETEKWGWRPCTPARSSTRATSPRRPGEVPPAPRHRGRRQHGEVSNYLKVGTMAIVLSMVEDDFIDRDLSIDGPVAPSARSRATSPAARRSGSRTAAPSPRSTSSASSWRWRTSYYRDREHEPWVRDVLARWEHDPRPAGRGSPCSSAASSTG